MEERKWEDLEMDCLVNVLGRVGMESLLLDVPFVCKSWHKASLNPLCWRRLNFLNFATDSWFQDSLKDRFVDLNGISRFSDTAFIKFIIDRSSGNATVLVLPHYCTVEAFKHAADECPALQILGLPDDLCRKQSSAVLELVGKWKNLEGLILGSSSILIEVLAQISLNCKNFCALKASGLNIGKEVASAIVTLLPKIKYLNLRAAYISWENIVTILQGCKELVYLDVSNAIGFEVDDKILELASHISTFKYGGARLFDDANAHDAIYDGYYSD